ncbi:unnamed protein product [Symbiodinium natans]|uniref:Uncharacterized protein n=1 Tax=Symbiodinium natans TaxID=878477 RepID=A0A812UWC2_9DINO|nr:unnamed protein product [Symbiodinium natans]
MVRSPASMAAIDRELAAQFGPRTFIWNRRRCYGTQFHLDVLNGKDEDAIRQLEQASAVVDGAFAYVTYFDNGRQICTGQAIHLAASRGHLSTVKVLLEKRADLHSMITKDGRDHSDVMHAAVFRERRGGSGEMIGYLCSQGANIQSQNSLGLSCLHMAFSTGNVETIRAVQQALKGHQGWRTEDDGGLSLRGETALEFGIRGGKCSVQTLAELAPITGSSLRSFIHHAPECIPLFLSYAFASHQDGQRVEQLLAQELTSKDMAQLLRLNPEVAVVLLHLFTAAPETMGEELAGDEGWHPLPKRVSFGSRVVSLLGLFGLQASWFHRIRCFYEADTVWRFDAETHTAPDWHRKVTDLRTPPMLEACIRVCYVPNLISVDIFRALSFHTGFHTQDAPAESIFGSIPIRAAVSYTFWKGALWVETLQWLISLWGLGLLVLQASSGHELSMGSDRMHGHLQHTNQVVADWIIARGCVDLFLELAQLWGCVRTQHLSVYFTFGNFWDLVRSMLPTMLLLHHQPYRLLQLLIVLIYWMRLWEFSILSDEYGPSLLPIQQLLSGLSPALMFTVVCFAALTHAMHTVQANPGGLWSETVYHAFTTLIAQGLPEQPPADRLELMLLYGGVLFFSVFVLNIFIGIIGEQYSSERALATHKFYAARASSCLTYLVRASVIPCDLCSSVVAGLLCHGCAFAALLAQILALAYGWKLPEPWQLLAFVFCQMTMVISAFQCRGSDLPWATSPETECYSSLAPSPRGRCSPHSRYLWIIEPRQDFEARNSLGALSGSRHEPLRSFSRWDSAAAQADAQGQVSSTECRQLMTMLREVLDELKVLVVELALC